MLGRIDTPQVNIGDFFVFSIKKRHFWFLNEFFSYLCNVQSINQTSRTSKFRESLGH